MKIFFYDAKPYDAIWFGLSAKRIGFEIVYSYRKLDKNTVEWSRGFDAICILEAGNIDRRLVDTLINNGTKAIMFRKDNFHHEIYNYIKERNIELLKIPNYTPITPYERAVGSYYLWRGRFTSV